MATKTISKCSKCGYPLAAEYKGQTVSCPLCGTVNEAISGIEIPTPLFVGIVCFFAGMFLGPALVATTTEGRAWLEKQARAKIRG